MVEQHETNGEATAMAKMNGMASQSDKEQQDDETGFRQRVETLLLCPVCHETVTDPRQLNCGHFLCSECVDLLTVEEVVRCAKCTAQTPVTEAGIRVDELAAGLLTLLAEFGPQTRRTKHGTNPASSPPANGIIEYMDDDDDEDDDDQQSSKDEQETTNGAEGVLIDIDATPSVNVNEIHKPNVQTDEQIAEMTEEPAEVILEPPEDYQSPDEEGHDESLPPPPPPIARVDEVAREPVEHDVTQTEKKVENTDEPAGQVEDKPEEGHDEPDRRMKASEMKPSDVAINIETERQCGDCHSNKCTCNVTLLTPPVSNGSQLSVDTNTSNNPSEDGEAEILVRPLAKFAVSASASQVEVANQNKIYVTRWTIDEKGSISTFESSGRKIKFVNSGHHNFTGLTLSKLGFIFALNSSKNRVEEYSGVDGKKVKQFKLDLCRDPQAVDIMSTGEILVVDQEKHRVIVYPNSKKGGSKPKVIKNELIREPYDIASTSEAFYITCAGTRSLLKMDLEGNIIWKYNGQTAEGKKPVKVLQGVCTDESGDVYVVDRDNDAVLVFTEDGELKGRIRTREKANTNQHPWYVSTRDGIMAVLFSHNLVKTYQLE